MAERVATLGYVCLGDDVEANRTQKVVALVVDAGGNAIQGRNAFLTRGRH